MTGICVCKAKQILKTILFGGWDFFCVGAFFSGGLRFFKEREIGCKVVNKIFAPVFFSDKACHLALQTTSGMGAVCRQPRRGVPQLGEVLLQHQGQAAAGVKVGALSPFQGHWGTLTHSFAHQFRA